MGPICTVCAHPKVDELNSRLQAEPAKPLAAELGMSLPAVYRHIRSGHHLPKPIHSANLPPGSTIAPRHGSSITPIMSATLRAVQSLAREAQRHLRAARKGDDIKATNGAITAAAKALELVGKLRGELQHGANVNVTLSTEQRIAIGEREQAQGLSAFETTELARSWLAAQLEAGDRDAMRIVLELVRLIPEAEVVKSPVALQEVTPTPASDVIA